ncbi:DNA ligase D [Flavisolibacter tropicus]|uniref:DNA ligase (ATP) n=1 Tax=Flavisolibacter tropicus TaxID=1492898 RepID=A0A172TV90_9BACT|nr:DNA ligase D [Flavisolibacter tropicus]ANE50657.1 DNA ligase [Flavisolibacter tropicus]
MGLSLYNKKRNFSQTPEPSGKTKTSKSTLRFVIQKHDASSLHYDFRLEMDGVLKSWAIPKGPSLNPADKRLAMMVEDHPYDYRNFEGVIPEGNYGAGTVIVWDEGYYTPVAGEQLSRKEQEQILLKELEMGSLKFILYGKKLNGVYTLRRMRKGEEKAWLLIKSKDEYATDDDVTAQEASVKSGKTLADIAAKKGVKLNHPKEQNATQQKGAKKAITAVKTAAGAKKISLTKRAGVLSPLLKSYKDLIQAQPMPANIKPAFATLVDEPFSDPQWLYEIKWDGYRALAYLNNTKVKLISRNNKPFTDKYAPVTAALKELGINAVFDGEIVAIDKNGLANFQLLQNWQNAPVQLQFYVFDILWLNGYDLTRLPLIERKKILCELIPPKDLILRYSDHVIGNGSAFYKAALKQGLEGIMAKRADSIYEAGKRTADWLKIKVNKRQEVVIAGFTVPRKTRKFFGALLLGVYEDDEFVYVGHTGSGFNTKSLKEIYDRLQPLVTNKSPFKKVPKTNMPATWVKPQLVCEIKFTEWTKEHIARHPIFMGLRTDKKAKDVRVEKEEKRSTIVKKAAGKKETKTPVKRTTKKKSSLSKNSKKISGLQLQLENGANQTVTINKIDLSLTNLDKIYWPNEGFQKIDSINHYLRMAPYILPFLLDRPHSLNRHPNGIGAPNFFQKDMKGKQPQWLETYTDYSESTKTNVEYLVCTNEASLIYMANLGCIEMNPWHSRVNSWQYPDWCLIDLDPEGVSFNTVIEVAQVIKKILDASGAKGYCKTSGATGMHIYIPLGAKYDFDQSKQLAELICKLVQQEMPNSTSMERSPAKRKEKVYLDFLQNKETQTAAAPYSIRPRQGASVSTPLHWDEVKKGLAPTDYTIKNIYERVKAEGDLFKPVLGRGINLEKVIQQLITIL